MISGYRPVWPYHLWMKTVAVAMLALLAAGCGSDETPVTSQTSNYQVDDNSAATDTQPSRSAPREQLDRPTSPGRSSLTSSPVSQQQQRQQAAPQRPSSQPPPTVNPSAPAGDSPQELLAFISELQTREPVGASREAAILDLQQTQRQIIAVAEQLLGSPAPEQALIDAARAKITALATLLQVGVDDAADSLLKFCDELPGMGHARLAELGRDSGLQFRLALFASGQSDDPQPILTRFRAELDGPEKNPQLLQLGRRIAAVLDQREFPTEAQQVYHDTAAAFANVQDPQIAASVKMLYEEADLAAVGISQNSSQRCRASRVLARSSSRQLGSS